MLHVRPWAVYAHYVLSLAVLLFTLDLIDLVRVMPELTQTRCVWPHEQMYGGYAYPLFVATILSAVIDFVVLLIVSVWYGHEQKGRRRVEVWRFGGTGWQYPVFEVGRVCGLHRWDRLPCATDFFLVVSFFVQLVLLAYHHRWVLALALLKVAVLLLLLVRDDHPARVRTRLTSPKQFVSETRVAVVAAFFVVLLFVALFALQYYETFSEGHRYLRSSQLRTMNDDRLPFNQPLTFHAWLNNASRELELGRMPKRRVVLFVLDGMRYDAVAQTNAAMRQWLRHSARANRTWLTRLETALPTMSAPNWHTLLSGVRPEISGMHGNIFSGETEFSTIASMLSRLDTSRRDFMWGMTGCPWWSELVKSHFPRLSGDGAAPSYSMYDVLRKHQTLPIDLELSVSEQLVRPPYMDFEEYSNLDGLGDDVTDQHRARVAQQALNQSADPFRFFLMHFTNVDTQAHYYGVAPEYNRANSYDEAVTRTARYIQETLDVLDAQPDWDTTVVITADHGEVDAGGHGGVAPILREVPLIVYRTPRAHDASLEEEEMPRIDDIAASVLALLRLPVPRQSTGRVLRFASSQLDAHEKRRMLQDLYEQQQEWLNVFALQGRWTSHEWCDTLADALQRNVTWVQTASVAELERGVARLRALYQQLRGDALVPLLARNVTLTAMLAAVLLLYMIVLLRRHTWVTHVPRIDKRAAAVGLLLTAAYLAAVLAVLFVAYYALGYDVWDSTWVHSVPAFLRFVWWAIVPGIVVQFVLVRAYHLPFLDWHALEPARRRSTHAERCCRHACWALGNALRVIFVETAFQQGAVTDVTWVYFVRFYAFAWSVTLWCALLVLQGTYSFCVPFVFSNYVLTDETWTLRFRIVSTQWACFPLLIGNLATLLSFARPNAQQLDWSLQPSK